MTTPCADREFDRIEDRFHAATAALGSGPLADRVRAVWRDRDVIDGCVYVGDLDEIVDVSGDPVMVRFARRGVRTPDEQLQYAVEHLTAALAAGAQL
ncbi:Uncharacterised protein [Mycobacteroides abscessus subsp. abscessus]|uniref:hypothetical protein n=1 Tax=Mycobacteroides abscessus TaxID=36809 RepID=UPI00092A8DBF|nr:hypothetical protein [Mycobacteroides abscessus]SHP29086.1 Uncharacterised protein [Mycobacteroides abscessus subsp. abscessus]SHP69378.1 Uncharacterised protein [Mycobacteroides abscessus subsp. abscessus]SHY39532.1 Uncharacterised protein [Mycobacteroides abscessus subsp. abscessus]SKD93158.1 Uncharacterised protein [Mycobacteroides abscessus subsp. abscessus]